MRVVDSMPVPYNLPATPRGRASPLGHELEAEWESKTGRQGDVPHPCHAEVRGGTEPRSIVPVRARGAGLLTLRLRSV